MSKKKKPSYSSRLRKAGHAASKLGKHLHKIGTTNSSKRLKSR